MGHMSLEYKAAMEAFSAAAATFKGIQEAWRAHTIDDATYMAARAVFLAAERAFDAAEAEEDERGPL